MKPVQLELINFGPYRHAVINFEDLEQEPLFLIGGHTGAGKSTLFDGMTMALFDQGTGERRSDEMRSTFAVPAGPLTELTFHFRQGPHLYRVKRTIKQSRASKRGNKITEHKPTAHLAIVDGVDGLELDSLASLHKDVGLKIQELLGFNAEQFKQVILLPQNEFRKFLHSESGDKLKTLKNIFGVTIFERFSKTLAERHALAKGAFERHALDLQAQFESQVWTEAEKEALSRGDETQKMALADGFVHSYQKAYEQCKIQFQLARDAFNQKSAQVEQAQGIAKEFEYLAQYQQQLAVEITAREAQYQQWLGERAALLTARELKPILDGWDTARQQAAQSEEALKVKEAALAKDQLDLAQARLILERLEGEKPAMDQLKQQGSQWEARAAQARQQEVLKASLHEAAAAKEAALAALGQLDKQLAAVRGQLEALQAARLAPEVLQEQQQKLLYFKRLVEEDLTRLGKELQGEEQLLKQGSGSQARLQEKIQAARLQLRALEEGLAASKMSRRALMVAQLRWELQAGEACSVCGALDHPFAREGLAADEAGLKASMEEVEQLQKQVAQLGTAIEKDQARFLEESDRLTEQQAKLVAKQSEADGVYKALKTAFPGLKLPAVCDFDLLIGLAVKLEDKVLGMVRRDREQASQMEQLQAQSATFEQQVTAAKVALMQKETLWASVGAQIREVESQYPDLEPVPVYVQKIESALKRVQTFEADWDKANKSHTLLSEKAAGLRGEIHGRQQQLAVLKGEGDRFEQQVGAWEPGQEVQVRALLPRLPELTDLLERISSFEERGRNIRGQIQLLSQRLADVEQPDLAALQALKAEAAEVLGQLTEEMARLQTRVEQTGAVLKRAASILARQEQELVRYGELTELHQVMNTDKGSKINLETYVIRVYLEKVLEHANRHYLNLLTNGRYQLSLSGDVRDGRKASGLNIDVFDLITGSHRSTKTLSGGETFICALAIALSLSEVVRNEANGTAIEALFIDEGFGSLDPEMLNLAMEALERIGENRMVGVISHVTEMKERISQQLVIQKQGDGSSEIHQLFQNAGS